MEKMVLFLDFANIDRSAKEKGYELDYKNMLDYIAEGRFLIDAHCYVPIDPRNEHRMDAKIEYLWQSGYIVKTKVGTIAGETYKCNLDIEITMDILRTIYTVKPDIVVLASGDSDFVPLVMEMRNHGIRVEIASFENTAAREIRLKGSGFINLDCYFQDSVLAQEDIEEEKNDEIIIKGKEDKNLKEDEIEEQEEDSNGLYNQERKIE